MSDQFVEASYRKLFAFWSGNKLLARAAEPGMALILGQESVGCGEVSSIPSSGGGGAVMEQMKLIQQGRKRKT